MKFTSALFAVAAAACALMSTQVAAQDKPLPWDGRGQDLTVGTLESKYMLHIFKQRQNAAKADPSNYVKVSPKGRSPAFNGDTGVISIAVDNDAIFGGQTNFRRSELVQNVAGNTAGKTFFRASVKKDKAWLNAHSWQIIFPESHLFEVRIDSSVTPPKIIFHTGGSLDVKWSSEFKLATWYNFGIAVGSGAIELYTSTGNSQLALTKSVPYPGSAPSNYEFHYGMLTLSNDGSAPKMVAGAQDVLDYNGVSVEKTVSGGGAAAPSPAADDDADDGTDETETPAATPAPKTTTAPKTSAPAATTAPKTSAPASTTSKPKPTTAAPAADADDDDEYSTPAPATDDEYATPTVSPSTDKPSKTPKATKAPKPSKTAKTPKPAKACKKKST